MKTSELTGSALDYWVAMAEGYASYYDDPTVAPNAFERGENLLWLKHGEFGSAKPVPKYSTDWAQGGPLIEKYRIDVRENVKQGWYCIGAETTCFETGDTPLQAICRTVVRAKFLDEVAD